jgi:hypothetical protein
MNTTNSAGYRGADLVERIVDNSRLYGHCEIRSRFFFLNPFIIKEEFGRRNIIINLLP